MTNFDSKKYVPALPGAPTAAEREYLRTHPDAKYVPAFAPDTGGDLSPALSNSLAQVSFSVNTGNVLSISNLVLGVADALYPEQPIPSNKLDYSQKAYIQTPDGNFYDAPFALYLFWRYFGQGVGESTLDPSHFGCVLMPKLIQIGSFSWKTNGSAETDQSIDFTWSITKLSEVYWCHNYGELSSGDSLNAAVRQYYLDVDFAAYDKNTGKIPQSYGDSNNNVFLTVNATATLQTDGTLTFGGFRVAQAATGADVTLDCGLHAFEYPFIRGIVEPNPNDASANFLAAPFLEGIKITDPIDNLLKITPAGDPARLTLEYPMGYGAALQFLTVFGQGDSPSTNRGFYMATHDDVNLIDKTFVLDVATGPRQFTFHVLHFNDDVCQTYDIQPRKNAPSPPDSPAKAFAPDPRVSFHPYDRLPPAVRLRLQSLAGTASDSGKASASNPPYVEYIPTWKDYAQPPYEVVLKEIPDPGVPIDWYDAANVYNDWVFNSNAPWIGPPRRGDRDWNSFYSSIGFAVGFLGSECYLDALPARNGQTFDLLTPFHKLLRQPPSGDAVARVLFNMGWDWHGPFHGKVRTKSTYQYGNNQALYWECWMGSGLNHDGDWQKLNRGGADFDFIVPYIYGLGMTEDAPVNFSFPGWTNKEDNDEDPGSPWAPKRLAPDFYLAPAHCLCPATPEYANFFLTRNRFVSQNPFQLKLDVPQQQPVSGNYHDVGFSFNGHRCFGCLPQPQGGSTPTPTPTLGQLHLHVTPDGSGGTTTANFRVGTGGFIYAAMRDQLSKNPFVRGVRAQIFGMEAMSEIFIDGVDFYTSAQGFGPYRPYDIAATHAAPNGGYTGLDILIMNGQAEEIPMLRYVYNHVMPIRVYGALISGGAPGGVKTRNNVGDMFYWMVAQAYISGAIVGLSYDTCLMDIPSLLWGSNNDWRDIPTYMSGWNQPSVNANVELGLRYLWKPVVVDDKVIWVTLHDPAPGMHNDPSSDPGDVNRTYGDPEKEEYLRMAAYMRSFVIPDYVVYGRMLQPGLIQPNYQQSLTYDMYCGFGDLPDGILPGQFKHSATCNVDCLFAASWRTIDSTSSAAFSAVEIIANIGSTEATFSYTIRIPPAADGQTVIYQTKMLIPPATLAEESSWDAPWQYGGKVTFAKGQKQWTIPDLPALPSHSFLLIRVNQES